MSSRVATQREQERGEGKSTSIGCHSYPTQGSVPPPQHPKNDPPPQNGVRPREVERGHQTQKRPSCPPPHPILDRLCSTVQRRALRRDRLGGGAITAHTKEPAGHISCDLSPFISVRSKGMWPALSVTPPPPPPPPRPPRHFIHRQINTQCVLHACSSEGSRGHTGGHTLSS